MCHRSNTCTRWGTAGHSTTVGLGKKYTCADTVLSLGWPYISIKLYRCINMPVNPQTNRKTFPTNHEFVIWPFSNSNDHPSWQKANPYTRTPWISIVTEFLLITSRTVFSALYAHVHAFLVLSMGITPTVTLSYTNSSFYTSYFSSFFMLFYEVQFQNCEIPIQTQISRYTHVSV